MTTTVAVSHCILTRGPLLMLTNAASIVVVGARRIEVHREHRVVVHDVLAAHQLQL